MNLIINVHTPTDELAKFATNADVGELALSQLVPSVPVNSLVEANFVMGMSDQYSGPIRVARDGMLINLAE